MTVKPLISTLTVTLALGFATPLMAASDQGIDCIGEGAPGQGAKALSELSQGGDNPFRPGIGNLAKSFNDGNDFQQPPLLMNSFCEIGNGKGKGPGHEPVLPD